MPELRPQLSDLDYPALLREAWAQHLAAREPDAPTVISTFAGAGGSSLGYSMAGYRELLAVEWDDNAVATFKVNFPGVEVYHGDIAKLTTADVLARTGLQPGELDIFEGSPPCFPAGTLVLTADGPLPIEGVRVGMKVVTHTGALRAVEAVMARHYNGALCRVETWGGGEVTCTPEHPFWACVASKVPPGDEGGDWFPAHTLLAGDALLRPAATEDKWIAVKTVRHVPPQPLTVYNLEVEQDHSYTADGFAVHNCQGFSTSGRRIMDDPRNYLFREFVRLLRGLQPRAFIMENVAGMVKGKMKLIFADIMRELKASGYCVSARLLNAAYFHVPQSRQRMIFIGVREDVGVAPSHPTAQSRLYTARDAWAGLPQDRMIPELDHVWVDEWARGTKWIGRASRLKPGQKLVEGVASAGRCHWNRPLPTMQKGLDNTPPYVRSSPVHPSQPRTLSIREMARAQSFPDEFRFVDALRNGQQRIGNSVPPLFMRAIALHVRTEILGLT